MRNSFYGHIKPVQDKNQGLNNKNVAIECHLMPFPNGSGIVCFFFPVSFFIYLRFCPFSLLFAAFWTSNLSLSIVFASFSWNLQHFGAGSCHFSGFDFYMIVPQFSLILSTVFIDSYIVFTDFFEVLIDFGKYTMCKL